jgi:hypothetical protein
MKKSELKDYIKEIILAELAEVTIVGPKTEPTDVEDIVKQEKTDRSTVQAAIQKAKNTNQPVGVAESEDEEPTQADIQKEKSLTKAQTEWAKITKELKSNVSKIKDIISKKPADRTKADEDLLTKMKELTKRKNQLKSKFSELDDEN